MKLIINDVHMDQARGVRRITLPAYDFMCYLKVLTGKRETMSNC